MLKILIIACISIHAKAPGELIVLSQNENMKTFDQICFLQKVKKEKY